ASNTNYGRLLIERCSIVYSISFINIRYIWGFIVQEYNTDYSRSGMCSDCTAYIIVYKMLTTISLSKHFLNFLHSLCIITMDNTYDLIRQILTSFTYDFHKAFQ